MPGPLPDLLKAFLDGRDIDCPSCGYNLRDLQGSRCPECGDKLSLQVGLVEPKQAAPIVGLIGLAAGAGMSGMLLLFILIRYAVFHDNFSQAETFVRVNLGGLVVEGAAVAYWLHRWRAVRRLPLWGKWLLAAACWVLTLLNLIVFTVAIK